MQISDIIYVSVLLAVAVAFVVLWYLRQRGFTRLARRLAGSDAKSVVSGALRELNVKAEWVNEADKQTVHYTYQGGHFNITLEKDSPYVRLTFLFFYQADTDDLETVRLVCNLCNLNTDACRIAYTLDEKKGKVDVHLISVLPADSKNMKDMLERVMSDAFRWQNTFTAKYEAQKKQGRKDVDPEKTKAMYQRDLQLIREQEMTHQDTGPDWHESAANPVELRSLVTTAMGLTDIIPSQLTLTSDGSVSVIDDSDAILEYHVHKPLIVDGAFLHVASVTGRLDFYDPRDPVSERHLMLDFESEQATADTLYYRVTMALVPMSLTKTEGEESERHLRLATSVLLGYDLTPPEQRLAHFRYVWKEAMAKRKAGDTEGMTDEEKTLADLQDPHIAQNYYRGRSLYLHKRYYEALLPLTGAYRAVAKIYSHNDHRIADLLDELAYFIGCCHMCLHQYEKAAYYLQMTLPTTHRSYTEAYVNCLVNSGDYRAMDIVDGLLASLQMMVDRMGDGDDDDNPHMPGKTEMLQFISFVKRRKAFMLVNLGRYGEAERLLKQLLDDPDSSDFALSELAYIQKRR